MKVLIPVIGFGKSGGYRVLSMLANELIRLGCEVSFVASANSNEPHFPTQANVIWIKEGRIADGPTKQPGSFLGHMLALRFALRDSTIVSRFDLILANHSLTAIAVPKKYRFKTVYYVQAYEPDYYTALGGLKNYFLAKLSERSYKLGLFTIVNSPIFKNFKFLRSERVLVPGIDRRFFFHKDQEIKSENLITLGTIGRQESYKGSSTIIDAFRILSERHPSMRMKIAFGEKKLQSGNIEVVHPGNDQELGVYYQNIDFYLCAGAIHPGAFHYPVLEAMACGTVVISTPYYGIDQRTAFVLQNNTVDALVELIEFAIQNDKLRSQKITNGSEEAAKLTWKSTGETLLSFLIEKIQLNEKTMS